MGYADQSDCSLSHSRGCSLVRFEFAVVESSDMRVVRHDIGERHSEFGGVLTSVKTYEKIT